VTASMAWPRFASATAEPQGAKQIAAPAETRTPNVHRANESLPESADRSMATGRLGRKKKTLFNEARRKTYLTPIGLLMEGFGGKSATAGIAVRGETVLKALDASRCRIQVTHG